MLVKIKSISCEVFLFLILKTNKVCLDTFGQYYNLETHTHTHTIKKKYF